MNKIVSIALFGKNHERYAVYLPAFVRGHLNLFPDKDNWQLRIHVDDHVAASQHMNFLLRLAADDLIDLVRIKTSPLTKSMLYRMLPLFDPTVDFVFCRDIDAPPMPRDRACCDAFMKLRDRTRCSVHTIHDNLQHTGIMGGLSGFHAPSVREIMGWKTIEDLYTAAETSDVEYEQHGVDQIVLNRLFLRSSAPRLFEHRFDGWHNGPNHHRTRGPGWYQCGGVSMPVPNTVETQPYRRFRDADHLGAHLGCAGYNYKAAVQYWDSFGDPFIATRVALCEEK